MDVAGQVLDIDAKVKVWEVGLLRAGLLRLLTRGLVRVSSFNHVRKGCFRGGLDDRKLILSV